jgi:hypothetical protein
MPRTLILCTALTALLAGCAQQATTPATDSVSCQCAEPYEEMGEWLAMERRTSAMDTSEVVAELVRLGRPASASEQFYFGTLNQQLGTPANWRQARDAFRALRKNTELTNEQRNISAMLERYNIYRLDDNKDRNDMLRDQAELERNLEMLKQENAQLEQKIQAITDLEADMSTRIEQEQ